MIIDDLNVKIVYQDSDEILDYIPHSSPIDELVSTQLSFFSAEDLMSSLMGCFAVLSAWVLGHGFDYTNNNSNMISY